jgi:Squalene-hopene cyclase C-terminal domain
VPGRTGRSRAKWGNGSKVVFGVLSAVEIESSNFSNLTSNDSVVFFYPCGKVLLSPSKSPSSCYMDSVTRTRPLSVIHRLKNRISNLRTRYGISVSARAEVRRERRADPRVDVPIDSAIAEALAWIGRAQDHSLSADGGVARHYCLINGWGTSYPETTGYIIPTVIREARLSGDSGMKDRARKMLDWLLSIQMPNGAFQGGAIGQSPVVPVTFNTGQILMGLAAGVSEFGPTYRNAMTSAADWLVQTQDPDGCWRKGHAPFARQGEKAYETHVAWGLFEAARVEPGRGYAEAAVRNLHWARSLQNAEGWFEDCCLTDPSEPLTHTIGYVLRGLVEAYLFTRDKKILEAAQRTAEGILKILRSDGYLPGRLSSSWEATVSWCCLTGSAQIAICWLLLYLETGDDRFRRAAVSVNRYIRGTVRLEGPPETRGAIKGSFPVSGRYSPFQYPNWACKFFIDANRLEKTVCEDKGESSVPLRARTVCLAD